MPNSIDNQMREIKKEFRRLMNGIVSGKMREKGSVYNINFGLTLPLILRVAQQHAPDVTLAQRLWNENVRESKMLAPLLFPLHDYSLETAKKWIAEITYPEIADICCMHLFSKTKFATELALDCINSDSTLVNYTGFQLLNRLISSGEELSPTLYPIITENILKKINKNDLLVRIAGMNLLKKGLRDTHWNMIIIDRTTPWLSQAEDTPQKAFANEICAENDFLKI